MLNIFNKILAEGRPRTYTSKMGEEKIDQTWKVIIYQGWGFFLNWLNRILAKTELSRLKTGPEDETSRKKGSEESV